MHLGVPSCSCMHQCLWYLRVCLPMFLTTLSTSTCLLPVLLQHGDAVRELVGRYLVIEQSAWDHLFLAYRSIERCLRASFVLMQQGWQTKYAAQQRLKGMSRTDQGLDGLESLQPETELKQVRSQLEEFQPGPPGEYPLLRSAKRQLQALLQVGGCTKCGSLAHCMHANCMPLFIVSVECMQTDAPGCAMHGTRLPCRHTNTRTLWRANPCICTCS